MTIIYSYILTNYLPLFPLRAQDTIRQTTGSGTLLKGPWEKQLASRWQKNLQQDWHRIKLEILSIEPHSRTIEPKYALKHEEKPPLGDITERGPGAPTSESQNVALLSLMSSKCQHWG